MYEYDVEVSLQRVEFKNKVSVRKVNLTVYAPDMEPVTYSHIVRHDIVSFYEQSIKFPYCNEVSIKVTLIPTNKLQNEQSRFFDIDIRSVTKMIKNRVQFTQDIPDFNCTVYYEVALFEPNMLQSSVSRDLTEMQMKEKNFLNSNESRKKQKKISKAPIDDNSDQSQKRDELEPLPDKLLGFGPKLKRSVTSPSDKQDKQQQLNRINKQFIRRPTGTKLKSIEEIYNQLEVVLTTRFNCQNYKLIQRQFASRQQELKKQLQILKSQREKKEKQKAEWIHGPGMLGSRAAMAIAFILGLLLSLIFRI